MSANSDPRPSPTFDPCGCGDPVPAGARRSQGAVVKLVNIDVALQGLFEAWLHDEGLTVARATEGGQPGAAMAPAVDLVIVDVPFPRQGGVDLIRRIASHHPAAPILALSSTFFPGIECCGPVARELGVACVLPKPVTREALAAAVRRVLPP
jgi:DNA-binding response OmpR family regulator